MADERYPPADSDHARRRLRHDPWLVAPRLLGATLTSTVDGQPVVVRLTEVEAYGGVGEDPGSHAHRGPAPSRASMFGPPGHAYVYFTYGMHWCLNVVAHRDGRAGGVLLRAADAIDGEPTAARRRGASRGPARQLASGPARLAAALGIDRALDGVDLLDAASPLQLRLRGRAVNGDRVGHGPRVGVGGEGAPTPWRFWLLDAPSVSRYRPAVARVRTPRPR
jgi:DNA-3-methyladenine glycosylase